MKLESIFWMLLITYFFGGLNTNKQDSLRIEISQLRLVCSADVNPKLSHARNAFHNLHYQKVNVPLSQIVIQSHSEKHYYAHNRLCTKGSGILSLFFIPTIYNADSCSWYWNGYESFKFTEKCNSYHIYTNTYSNETKKFAILI